MRNRELRKVVSKQIAKALTDLPGPLIARVTAVHAESVDAQPVVNKQRGAESVPMPVFPNVIPLFLQGGGSYEAHPIAVGDYCLLIVTERALDNWYRGRDFVVPNDYRVHDYSDCIAIVGVNPLADAIPIPTKTTRIGDSIMEGEVTHTGDYVQEGDLTRTGNSDQTGNSVITGRLEVTNNTGQPSSFTGGVNIAGPTSLGGGGSVTGGIVVEGEVDAEHYAVGDVQGVSGTFTTADGKSVTVTEGIVTEISS